MKVFISWSGERSHRVALLLREWLQCVIQRVDPWVSSKDIERGSLWFTEISQQLGETTVGILCLTQENKEKPWILFEAGALAKGLNSSRVCTLLIDLDTQDVGEPLAHFNHTMPTKAGMFGLVSTLNSSSGTKILDDQVLQRVFDTYWPQFEAQFAQILREVSGHPAKPRAKDDVLAEILENTRALSVRIRKLEERAPGLVMDHPNPSKGLWQKLAAQKMDDYITSDFKSVLDDYLRERAQLQLRELNDRIGPGGLIDGSND